MVEALGVKVWLRLYVSADLSSVLGWEGAGFICVTGLRNFLQSI